MQESFTAYVVKKNDDRVEGEVTTLRADQLPAGDVTIAVAYSSLNYKDALAAVRCVETAAREGNVHAAAEALARLEDELARLTPLLAVCAGDGQAAVISFPLA